MKFLKVSSAYFEVGGIVLSLIAFFVLLKGDPFGLTRVSGNPEHTAFFVSIIVLLLTEKLASIQRKVENETIGNNIVEMVKSSHSVTQFRDPRSAIHYVRAQLPQLRDVENISVNMKEEIEHVDSQLYRASEYSDLKREIAQCVMNGLRWRDIGDQYAETRFSDIANMIIRESSQGIYKYKFLKHKEPQMTFIVLRYRNGSPTEVLFNWDYRQPGQEPIVLLSRDERIVQMYSIHFSNLWQTAS